MSQKRAVGWIGACLLLSVTLCLAQEANNMQQQITDHRRKAQQYLQEKKPDLAIPELQALVALDPNNTEARGNLGVLLFFKGDYANAAPLLRAAINRRAGLWRIQTLLGFCELKLGDTSGARADFESAFPHLDDEKIRLQAGMQLIDLYASSGDLDKATKIVEVLRSHDPANIHVLLAAYKIYSQLCDESILSLSMADPDSAEMHEVMAREMLRYGDSDRAIAQYRTAIKIDPKLPGIHFELAEALSYSLNPADKAEAESEYKLALEMNPGDAKAMCRLGEIDVAGDNLPQAYAEYSRAVKLAPTDIDANLGLAHTMIRMKKNDQALPILEQVIKLDPADETAHYLLSQLLWQQDKKEDAKQELELYKKYKAMKEKLQTVYKQLKMAPPQSHSGDVNYDGNSDGI